MNTEMTDRFRGVIRRWAIAMANIERSGPREAELWIGVEKGIDRTVFELSLGHFDGFGKDEYEAIREVANQLADEMLDGDKK